LKANKGQDIGLHSCSGLNAAALKANLGMSYYSIDNLSIITGEK
jgi:hypothetical protein